MLSNLTASASSKVPRLPSLASSSFYLSSANVYSVGLATAGPPLPSYFFSSTTFFFFGNYAAPLRHANRTAPPTSPIALPLNSSSSIPPPPPQKNTPIYAISRSVSLLFYKSSFFSVPAWAH